MAPPFTEKAAREARLMVERYAALVDALHNIHSESLIADRATSLVRSYVIAQASWVESVLDGFMELGSLVDHVIVTTTRSDLRIEDRQRVLMLLQRGLKHILSVVEGLIETSKALGRSQLPQGTDGLRQTAQQLGATTAGSPNTSGS